MENECGFSNPPPIKSEYVNKDESRENINECVAGVESLEQDKKSGSRNESAGISGSTQPPPNGYEMPPTNHYLRNAILDEVLSEKKMALLWSPQVIKFLQEQQIAKRSNF